MSKILITSGCSFSIYEPQHFLTWTGHLENALGQYGYGNHISTSMGSQGNGLISRGALHSVITALKTYEPQDILVGIMWSGSNRHDYRCAYPDTLSFGNINIDGWVENPTAFIKDAPKNWIILNHGWKIEEAKAYYKYFYDYIGAIINSLEHILRLQLFLKSKNIPYFFTNFTDNNIIPDISGLSDLEYGYLYEQLDFDNYLPVTSEHRWLYENSVNKEEYRANHAYKGKLTDWIHPTTDLHKEFVDGVIVPYLHNKGII
jgi:hypothetical protein